MAPETVTLLSAAISTLGTITIAYIGRKAKETEARAQLKRANAPVEPTEVETLQAKIRELERENALLKASKALPSPTGKVWMQDGND